MNRRRLMAGLTATAALAGCSPMPETEPPEREREGRKGKGKEGSRKNGGRGSKDAQKEALPERADVAQAPEAQHLERVVENFEGFERMSFRYMPKEAKGPVPLVLICHGNGGEAAVMYRQNGLLEVVRRLGWAAIFPNTGRKDVEQGDESYLSHLVGSATDQFDIDRKRIFGVGFSGGGKSTYRLAARRKFFKAIAVSGCRVGHRETPELWNPDQCGAGKVSILHIHGKADAAAPWKGGVHENHPDLYGIPFVEGLEIWANHNGCTPVAQPSLENAPPTAELFQWAGPDGLSVNGVLDPTLKHQWAKYANRLVYDFLQQQAEV